ncbi:MAG: metallophosphoesterase family protein [Piscinibacter sp.]|nr:metallophosphoesterase family protein [Piscinibacter sp.]
MRLAVVSDIHGNLPALEAVLEDIAQAGADLTVNLGDIVSGPLWPVETARRLMALALPTIRGNHERQVLAPDASRMGPSDAFAAARLEPAQRDWLAALPPTLQLDAEVFCCHGTPSSDLDYLLETVVPGFGGPGQPGIRAATADEAAQRVGDVQRGVPQALILCGHSHVPRALQLADGRLLVNPGSVGLQAYDDGRPHPHVIENDTPHARYALLTRRSTGWQVELRALPYDAEDAARRADENGRGDWADALRSGRVGRWEGVA